MMKEPIVPGDRPVGLDDALHEARVITDPRHVVEERLTIGSVLGGEGGHPDRLRILHLFIDRVEIGVHDGRSETFIRASILRPVEELVGYFSGTLRLSANRLTSSVCSW